MHHLHATATNARTLDSYLWIWACKKLNSSLIRSHVSVTVNLNGACPGCGPCVKLCKISLVSIVCDRRFWFICNDFLWSVVIDCAFMSCYVWPCDPLCSMFVTGHQKNIAGKTLVKSGIHALQWLDTALVIMANKTQVINRNAVRSHKQASDSTGSIDGGNRGERANLTRRKQRRNSARINSIRLASSAMIANATYSQVLSEPFHWQQQHQAVCH